MGSEFEKWRGDGSDEAYDLAKGHVDASWIRETQRWAWNGALAAVEASIPYPMVGLAKKDERGVGWNNCLSTMSERIAALREKPE